MVVAIAPLTTLNTNNMEAEWLQVFIMGEQGCGKTELAATFPRPLFLQPVHENSTLTLKDRGFEYIKIDSRNNPLVAGVGGMLSVISSIENAYNADPAAFQFDTIVVESVGHYADIVQRELSGGTQSMDQQKWGLMLSHFNEIQARLRRLDVHLVWTAHTKIDRVNDTTTICGANVQGQASIKLPSSCDIVIFMERVGKNFTSHFAPFKGFNARSRFRHPDRVVNCSFKEIEKYVKGATA